VLAPLAIAFLYLIWGTHGVARSVGFGLMAFFFLVALVADLRQRFANRSAKPS
jgi:hypothetical protein